MKYIHLFFDFIKKIVYDIGIRTAIYSFPVYDEKYCDENNTQAFFTCFFMFGWKGFQQAVKMDFFRLNLLNIYYFTKGERDMTNQLEDVRVNGSTSSVYDERELLEQLLKPEVQESLATLVELLPKLAELTKTLTAYYDTLNSLLTDEVLKNETIEAIKDITNPVTDSIRTVAQTVIEAKDRAEESDEVIGVFGLLRMLKDPQVQKLFRFINAYLAVAQEKETNK